MTSNTVYTDANGVYTRREMEDRYGVVFYGKRRKRLNKVGTIRQIIESSGLNTGALKTPDAAALLSLVQERVNQLPDNFRVTIVPADIHNAIQSTSCMIPADSLGLFPNDPVLPAEWKCPHRGRRIYVADALRQIACWAVELGHANFNNLDTALCVRILQRYMLTLPIHRRVEVTGSLVHHAFKPEWRKEKITSSSQEKPMTQQPAVQSVACQPIAQTVYGQSAARAPEPVQALSYNADEIKFLKAMLKLYRGDVAKAISVVESLAVKREKVIEMLHILGSE